MRSTAGHSFGLHMSLPALLCCCCACFCVCPCSRVSTPVKRKNRDWMKGDRDYGSGHINAYPPAAAAGAAGGAAGAVMMSRLAEELLTKKGLNLKDLQVRQACFWFVRVCVHVRLSALQAVAAATTARMQAGTCAPPCSN
jgi:hypothetical protein